MGDGRWQTRDDKDTLCCIKDISEKITTFEELPRTLPVAAGFYVSRLPSPVSRINAARCETSPQASIILRVHVYASNFRR